jgi:hypothetical protein
METCGFCNQPVEHCCCGDHAADIAAEQCAKSVEEYFVALDKAAEDRAEDRDRALYD